MGVYNIFGERSIQLKVESYEKLQLKHYKIGDNVELGDGIYVGNEGVVVILRGIFIAEFAGIWDKWGGFANAGSVIEDGNPVAAILATANKKEDTIKYPYGEEGKAGERDDQ